MGNALPDNLQEVYRLYYEEGMTQRKISEKLGISIYRVTGSLSKARYLIRQFSNGDKEIKPAGVAKSYRLGKFSK